MGLPFFLPLEKKFVSLQLVRVELPEVFSKSNPLKNLAAANIPLFPIYLTKLSTNSES